MVHPSIIEARLSRLGVRPSRWFRPEIRELENTLVDNEQIIAVVPGRYFGGYALLVATDLRLLLIDKRAFFMSLEDIRYDMISEVDFNSRILEATVQIFSVNKQHRFTSMKHRHHLKKLTTYIQQRVMEIRQHQVMSQMPNVPSQNPAPRHFFDPSLAPRPLQVARTINTSSHHLAQVVGAAAMKNLHQHYSIPNPYTNAPLVTRRTAWGSTTSPY